MSVDYNQRCAEKACPFHVEPGSLPCRFHRRSFTYGMSMEDNAVPFMDSLRGGLNTGFRLPARPACEHSRDSPDINREDRRIRVVTQILATGNLLPGCISALEFASPRDLRGPLHSPGTSAGPLHGSSLSRWTALYSVRLQGRFENKLYGQTGLLLPPVQVYPHSFISDVVCFVAH